LKQPVHLTIQTEIEGLPDREMKMFISVEGETEYAIARLGGSAVIVGWDIYLRDKTTSAKQHLRRAQEQIEALEADIGAGGRPTRLPKKRSAAPLVMARRRECRSRSTPL